MKQLYLYLADFVLFLHLLFVLFVVGALLLTIIGGLCHWRWVRNWWFRLVHMGAITVVVVQSWFGVICPLTILEMWLRARGEGSHYAGSFIQYWMDRLLYYSAPEWVFITIYTSFALLVILTWVFFPPHSRVNSH